MRRCWQLSGVPSVHDVCVFMAQNKDSRLFVNQIFSKKTQERISSHLLEPIRGPKFWPKLPHLPTALPPVMRVLPGRPKKCKTINAHEKRKRQKSGTGHNKKTFPLNQPDGTAIEPLVNEQAEKSKKKGGTKRKAGTSMSQPSTSNLGDGSSSTQPAHSQPPKTSRKSKKSM
ncbi:hypothetical protein LIER_34442 [Lithospermum erythrorhizon]|uniref:Uncharacterized protein n=1 Tax=Lithospermum erythrorhizon TaxID=34254 RepID=A0AAV3S1P5_LITER